MSALNLFSNSSIRATTSAIGSQKLTGENKCLRKSITGISLASCRFRFAIVKTHHFPIVKWPILSHLCGSRRAFVVVGGNAYFLNLADCIFLLNNLWYTHMLFCFSIALLALLTCNINHAAHAEWAHFVGCTAVYWKIVKSNLALHIGKYFSIYCNAHTLMHTQMHYALE